MTARRHAALVRAVLEIPEQRYWIAGEPVAQARARVTRTGHAYYPEKSAEYRRLAALVVAAQTRGMKFDGAVAVVLTFYRTRPKSNKSEWPVVRPDLDNFVKMTLDALKDAGVLHDDAQVCILHAAKRWTDDRPGVEVRIRQITERQVQQ